MKDIEQQIQEEIRKFEIVNSYFDVREAFKEGLEKGSEITLSQWKEAERWRDVNEELPEETFETYVDGRYRYTTQSFLVKTVNGKYAISKRVQFMYHEIWEWNGSGTFKSSITHWKPMETITDKE